MTNSMLSSTTGAPLYQVVVSFLQCCGLAEQLAQEISTETAASIDSPLSDTEIGDLLLTLMDRRVAVRKPVTYISLPITTGRAYLEWRAQKFANANDRAAPTFSDAVRTPNRRRAERVVAGLRQTLEGVVVDPSKLNDIPGWNQNDYHMFWTRLMARYIDAMVFVDGWQYSVGCTIEFAEAIRLKLPMRSERLTSLSTAEGVRLVEHAVRDYKAVGVDSRDLEHALYEAGKLADVEATCDG